VKVVMRRDEGVLLPGFISDRYLGVFGCLLNRLLIKPE
jgi:hypothetical protein